MRLVCRSEWSLGRERRIVARLAEACERVPSLQLHDLSSDFDLNRTIVTCSGPRNAVFRCLRVQSAIAFETVDLNRHVGSFPRIGALDLCRLMPLAPTTEDRRLLRLSALRFARWLATRHHVPVVLDERLQSRGKDHHVQSLRAKGFGMLPHTRIRADAGPDTAHPRLGVAVLAESEFLLTAWVLLAEDRPRLAARLADQAQHLRAEGDERFLGVACGAYPLASQGLSLLDVQWAMPEVTGCDPALEWVIARAHEADVVVPAVRLVGAIRESDIPRCARLPFEPRQVIARA